MVGSLPAGVPRPPLKGGSPRRCGPLGITSQPSHSQPLEMASQGALSLCRAMTPTIILSCLLSCISIFILSSNFRTSSGIPTTKPCLDLHWVSFPI